LAAHPLGRWAYAVPWSVDGQLLAVLRGRGLVQVYSAQTGQELAALSTAPAEEQVRGAAWSRDGLLLATGGDDGAVRLWGVPA
jgi:WD40 repeat protein